MYWSKNKIKLEVALAKGKQTHDKRDAAKDRDWAIEKQRVMRRGNRDAAGPCSARTRISRAGSTLHAAQPASAPSFRIRGTSAACITARCITTASSGAWRSSPARHRCASCAASGGSSASNCASSSASAATCSCLATCLDCHTCTPMLKLASDISTTARPCSNHCDNTSGPHSRAASTARPGSRHPNQWMRPRCAQCTTTALATSAAAAVAGSSVSHVAASSSPSSAQTQPGGSARR
ncbi:hypothetical protein G6F50_013169 [Rhizopus delemar]|uniref:Uncharacterized protein n=1 Tax=Rhizopus delemar TaxID=936053 RepID=A0A9P6YMF5_9FUNG|nr:hypothetical protein G6F50_013169 [Rhizopus delemar]